METAAISHRVADFLKKHPPFHAMEEGDLLDLARQGRVRFFEENEYIVWQGEPYRMQVFVIQQGSVSLWDEAGQVVVLRDVRGAGDMLGIEQLNDAGCYPYSAKSASDVVIYAFPANAFKAFVLKYEYARRYAAAYGNVNADYQSTEERREPQEHLSARTGGTEEASELQRPRQHPRGGTVHAHHGRRRDCGRGLRAPGTRGADCRLLSGMD